MFTSLAFGIKDGRSNFSVSGTYLEPSPNRSLGGNIQKLEKRNETTKIKGIVSCAGIETLTKAGVAYMCIGGYCIYSVCVVYM